MSDLDLTANGEVVRQEFNRWAQAGRGEEMAEEHAAIVAGMLAQMEFQANDRILDLGCGSGWLCGILADKVPQGQVIGIDVADEMVRRARKRAPVSRRNPGFFVTTDASSAMRDVALRCSLLRFALTSGTFY